MTRLASILLTSAVLWLGAVPPLEALLPTRLPWIPQSPGLRSVLPPWRRISRPVPPLASSSSSSSNEGEGEEENPYGPAAEPHGNVTLVTREMFQRELLADPPVVKRKQKGKGKQQQQQRSSSSSSSSSPSREYKVLDNRDSLPFRVENQVPDPYTKKEIKRRQANKVRKRPNGVEEGLKSSLYLNRPKGNENGEIDGSDDRKSDMDSRTMIGEYFLDKHTTTGDILEIGDTQYKVIRHKCQYKYAGGKRFVMVRKILQVKEIGRLQTEEYLYRQLRNSEQGGTGESAGGGALQ